MANLNKVMLIGRLTKDPELRFTPSGQAVCDMGIAVSNRYKTKSGETKDDTLFINVTTWARQAELCAEYLKKGRTVYVEGRLKKDSWTAQDGQKRSSFSVVAQVVQFLDAKGIPPAADAQGPPETTAPEDTGQSQEDPQAPPDEDIPF